jgi:hypothetical protein
MELRGQKLGRLEIDTAIWRAGGVRKATLDDGMERGIRVHDFRAGTGLCFDYCFRMSRRLEGVEAQIRRVAQQPNVDLPR